LHAIVEKTAPLEFLDPTYLPASTGPVQGAALPEETTRELRALGCLE